MKKTFLLEIMAIAVTVLPKGGLLYCSPSDSHGNTSPQHDSTRHAFVLDCDDQDGEIEESAVDCNSQ